MPRFDNEGTYVVPTDRQMWRSAKFWMLIFVAVLIVVPLATWGLSVLLSEPAGRGNQVRQINRAENRTFAQEQFFSLVASIKSYDQQLAPATAAANAATDSAEHDRLATVVLGLTNQCINARQQYNAEARKVSKARFRDADLPLEIDELDPATDCKP